MANTKIPSELVAINAISGTLIADNAITSVHIAQNNITATQIAINAVTALQMADGTITSAKIADGTIVTADIAAGQITTDRLADSAVTTGKIAAGTIVAGDIANNAIHTQHIDDNQITADQIADNAVGIGQLAGIARGKIIVGDSAGNPALLALGAANTLLQSDGTDIVFAPLQSGIDDNSNAVAITINSSENVGVGVTNPSSAKLQVDSASGTTMYISNSNPNAVGDIVHIRDNEGASGANSFGGIKFSSSPGHDPHIGKRNAGSTGFFAIKNSSATEVFTIDLAVGKVGIGDTTPTAKLTVENNAHGNYLYVGGSTQQNRGLLFTSAVGSLGSDYLGAKHTITAQSGGGEIYIKNDSHDWLALAPNGNVGINRLTPQSKLEVWTGNGQLSHFGSNAANTTNQYTGITLGYAEAAANSNYRKVGIVSVGRGDGAARQDLAFLVDSNSDGNSVDLGDTKMRISHEGYVTLSYQPAFSVRVPYISAQNYTGGATTICLNPSVIYANIGNHFSGSTGRFTAPVAGYYVFGACVRYDSFTGNYFYMTLTKNAGTFLARHLSTATGSYLPMTITAATSLAAGDYVHIVVQSSGDSAVAIDGDSNFFGYLAS